VICYQNLKTGNLFITKFGNDIQNLFIHDPVKLILIHSNPCDHVYSVPALLLFLVKMYATCDI